jgi:Putative prokaryotic signal transducing protein
MRAILRTSSISLAEALRLALEAEDIPVFVSNENLGGLPPAAITVTIADDADYERSIAILNGLQQTTPHDSSPTRRLVRLFVIIVVGAFCILCASLY